MTLLSARSGRSRSGPGSGPIVEVKGHDALAFMTVSFRAVVTVSSPLGASRSGRPIARCEPADRGEKPAADEEAAGEQRETERRGGANPESSPREAPSRIRGLRCNGGCLLLLEAVPLVQRLAAEHQRP